MSSKRLPWCKLFESWYTTRSHLELGGVALNIGPRLMSLANSSRTARGQIRADSGSPLSLSAIARSVRFTEAETASALSELVACGTLEISDDGCWFFPRFLEWQETQDAERMRRNRSANSSRTVTPSVTPSSVLSLSDHDLTLSSSEGSVRGGKEELREPPVITLPCSGGKSFAVTQSQIDRWAELFPAVDVLATVRKAIAWAEANPRKRKTAQRAASWLASVWLSKAQDEPRPNPAFTERPKYETTAQYAARRAFEEAEKERSRASPQPAQGALRIAASSEKEIA